MRAWCSCWHKFSTPVVCGVRSWLSRLKLWILNTSTVTGCFVISRHVSKQRHSAVLGRKLHIDGSMYVQLAEQIEALDPEQRCSDYWLGKADREAAAAGLPPVERAPRNAPKIPAGPCGLPKAKRNKRNRCCSDCHYCHTDHVVGIVICGR